MMKRMLLLLTLLALSTSPLFAREHSAPAQSVRTVQSAAPLPQGFSGDGTQWWVIEQIIAQIKEFVSSHISNQQP